MLTTDRDPVNAPWPGLVMRKGRQIRRVVVVRGGWVQCEDETGNYVCPWLGQWRRWAAKAEVMEDAK